MATSIRSYLLAAVILTAPCTVMAQQTFFGEDFTDGTLPAPNSEAAEADFLSNLAGVRTEDFEGLTDGDRAPINVMFGPDTATIMGGSNTQVADSSTTGQFAISGNNFLVTSASRFGFGGSGTFELSFSTPQAAFGFYGTDIGDVGGQLQLSFDGGTPITVPHTVGSGQTNNGSTIYFGYIDLANPFTTIEFSSSTSGTGDVFGFDDFTIGRSDQVIVVDNPPVAGDDAYEVQEGQTLSVNAPGALANDSDPEGGALTAAVDTSPANALSFVFNPDGSFSYTPAAGFSGTDSFTYTANDGTNASNIATVTITVTPDPLACIDVLQAIVDAYQSLVDSTVAQETPNIQALLDSGDFAGAEALVQSTVALLISEGGNASTALQAECANCMAQLTADGNQEFIPTISNVCVELVHRIGGIQAQGVGQLESLTATAGPPVIAVQMQTRYLREIELNRARTLAANATFEKRYGQAIRRLAQVQDARGANVAADRARQTLERTVAARIQRIQQLCDNFVARSQRWPGARGLANDVVAAASAAMAELNASQAGVIQTLQNARGSAS